MASSLPRRIAVAVVAIPTAFALVYAGGWPLALGLAAVGVLGTDEVFRFARARDVTPLTWIGYAGAAAAPLMTLVAVRTEGRAAGWLIYGGIAWFVSVMAGAVWRRPPDARPLGAIAVTVFGAVYTGVLPAFLLILRHGGDIADRLAATWLVFLPLAVTWICDSMAMAGGALVGGPKFAPLISPNKTWAGTISGSLFATLGAPVYGLLLLVPAGIDITWWRLALLGFVLSIVGQIGDLAESLLKREAGVKDSGKILPGHGGILDRLDSLYWALPVAAFMLTTYGAL